MSAAGEAFDAAGTDAPAADGRMGRLRARTVTLARQLAHTWQHSLQLRVAATTVAVTGFIVVIVGIFLVDQITSGILRAKKDAAITQANLGLESARRLLAGVSPGDAAGIQNAIADVTADLTANGNAAGLFTISIQSSDPVLQSGLTGYPPIPTALRSVVQRGNLAVQYAKIRAPSSQDEVRGLIVGLPISARAGNFELYYLFPLTAEENTVALVQRTAWLAGLGLVLFTVLITVLIARQVVRPVRVAAQTAERLAAGDLAQRIPTRGTDDIARLGQSFNDMAGSLQRQIRRLEELSRLQRRFTSDVSHELRTPLTTIRMASELLYAQRADFSPALARSAELLQTELDRFESLLSDLLEISRYDAGVARLEAETSDLRVVVANAVDANRVLAMQHSSELEVIGPDRALLVEMDDRRVERVLRNLIGNALDHGEGRPVVVTIGAAADAVAVTVRDHGVGLRPGEAALVFNRFWRGDPSRSRLTGGTGLGLAISLEDVRLHGGWLQAWGERGRGAQFRVTLPVRLGEPLLESPLPLEPTEEAELEQMS